MLGDVLLSVIEWIGTIVFSASGALVAIGAGLDFFGVLVVGCITATGGGIMRDMLIGSVPPVVFSSFEFLIIAVVTAALVFLVAYTHADKFGLFKERIDHISILFDALGLGVFTVGGVEHAVAEGCNLVTVLTAGVITGVGGGVLRDILVNEKPYILTKHIYALASILGCVLYYVIGVYAGHSFIATIVCVLSVLIIRILAAAYRWELPKVDLIKSKK